MAAALVDEGGNLVVEAHAPTPQSDDAEAVFGALIDGHRAGRPPPEHPVVCGVGCGGPMTAGGERVSPLNIGAWRRFPSAPTAGRGPRVTGLRGQRRQGLGPGRGLAGSGPGSGRLYRHGGVRPASAAASSSTIGCWTAPPGMPGTSATWWSSPTAGPACAVAAVASRPRRPGCRSPPSPGTLPPAASDGGAPTDRHAGRSGGGLGGQSPRSSSWPWWPVRSPWVSGPRSSKPPKRRSTLRSRLDFSAGDPNHPGRTGRGRAPGRGGGGGSPGTWSGRRAGRGPTMTARSPRGLTAGPAWALARCRAPAPRSVVDRPGALAPAGRSRPGGAGRRTFPFPTPASGISAWSPPTAGPMPIRSRRT